MQCSVYDTYVTKQDSKEMHFDIIVLNDTSFEEVIAFGKKYLKNVGQGDQKLVAQKCNFCHIEEASAEIENSIRLQGYYILAMQGCPPLMEF